MQCYNELHVYSCKASPTSIPKSCSTSYGVGQEKCTQARFDMTATSCSPCYRIKEFQTGWWSRQQAGLQRQLVCFGGGVLSKVRLLRGHLEKTNKNTMATAPGNIEVCSIHQKTSCGTVFRHTEVFRAFISEILAPTGEKELCLRSSKYIFDRLIFIQSFWIVCRPQCNTFSSQLLSSKVMTRYKNSWQLDKWQRDAYKTVGWGGPGGSKGKRVWQRLNLKSETQR